jgi:hypothetical protein
MPLTLQALIDELTKLRDQQKLHPFTDVVLNYANSTEGVVRIAETRGIVVLVTTRQSSSGGPFETSRNVAP